MIYKAVLLYQVWQYQERVVEHTRNHLLDKWSDWLRVRIRLALIGDTDSAIIVVSYTAVCVNHFLD